MEFTGLHLRKLPHSSLHSRFVPTAEDEISIQKNIQQIKSTVESVDDEITRLRRSLTELEDYRDQLYDNLMRHQAVLSPIRKVPPEILAEIFLHASEGSSVVWPRQNGDVEMPMLLGRICSFWRTITLSLPLLWSNIRLDLSHGHETADSIKTISTAVHDLVDICLSRSGNALLSFSITADGPHELITSILQAFVKHSSRWRDVSIDLARLSWYHRTLMPTQSNVPNLYRLHLGTSAKDTLAPDVLDAFRVSPSLRELSISYLTRPFHILRVPWAQLTHLTSKMSTFREGEFSEILRHATSLVVFSTEGERILEVTSSQPVLLPHLQKLAIVNKGSYITKSFQFFTAPNLKELYLHAITPFNPEQTIAMLTRSNCKLTHLTLHSSQEVDAVWEENFGIARLLVYLPTLVHLHLIVLKSADDLIHRLGLYSNVFPQILPNLECFMLEDGFCVSAYSLAEMLRSRINNVTVMVLDKQGLLSPSNPGLRRVRLKLSLPPPPKFVELDHLKGFAECHGVDITIQTSG
ncbi:hypothetical protein BYT27DRAFT_7198479 [Phlegmacium glaucopus]|nr:hypothetical protein BYT27DRAFT_7198479 [Phlegmacium glaucopus]